MARECTIEDIAQELGVSKTTVSRAISGKGRISDATRQRILRHIDERGFRPSAVAKGLAKSRTYNVGLVIPSAEASLEFAFFRECIMGISEYAAGRDYDVILILGDHISKVQRVLENRKVDALVAARSEEGSGIAELARAHGVPFVQIGAPLGSGAVFVDNSNELAAGEMTERLIDMGLSRLALFGGNERYAVTVSRTAGFERACLKRGVVEDRVFRNVTTPERVHDAVTSALAGGCEAIICMDDAICEMTMQELGAAGIAVPGAVKVACLYDSVLMEKYSPPVTAVRFDGVKLGAEACRQAIRLIEGEKAENVVIPDFEIVIRKST